MVKIAFDKKIILSQCKVASSFSERLIGLLSTKKLKKNEALLIEKCKQVHTFFMRFPIDVIFLDKDNYVLGVSQLKPWRFSKYYFKAAQALETNLGFAQKMKIYPGKKLEILNA